MEKSAFDKINFLSAAEVAEKLKLHPQVVARKLQTGEIPGYKIGKDWRVADTELVEWLTSRSNQNRPSERERVERIFFQNGRLKEIPAQHKKRRIILERLLQEFALNRVYPEAEVNEILAAFHEDVCTLRREFIMAKMMSRTAGKYRRLNSYRIGG